MKLLSDAQIDRWVQRWCRLLLFGLCLMLVCVVVPRGWGLGFFTGFELMSFGILALRARNWRSERGLWMYGLFLTLSLGSCWLYFEYLSFCSLFLPGGNRGPIQFKWSQVRFLIDTILALAVLSMTVKFALFCAIKNWDWTRGRKVYGCGLRAGESVRLKNDLVYGFGSSDMTLAAGTIWHVLQGRLDAPDAVILADPDRFQLAWVDDLTIYHQFELVD